jgi:hypothetical protein
MKIEKINTTEDPELVIAKRQKNEAYDYTQLTIKNMFTGVGWASMLPIGFSTPRPTRARGPIPLIYDNNNDKYNNNNKYNNIYDGVDDKDENVRIPLIHINLFNDFID